MKNWFVSGDVLTPFSGLFYTLRVLQDTLQERRKQSKSGYAATKEQMGKNLLFQCAMTVDIQNQGMQLYTLYTQFCRPCPTSPLAFVEILTLVQEVKNTEKPSRNEEKHSPSELLERKIDLFLVTFWQLSVAFFTPWEP